LEGVARQPPVHRAVLEQGLLDNRIEVQRTAQRLLDQQPSSED